MRKAYIAGIGMTPFGKHIDTTLSSLASRAITAALDDTGMDKRHLQAAYMGNAAAATITGQVCIAGEVALRSMSIGKIPVVNVENACATAATAFQQAVTMIEADVYDIVLACGYEKLYHEDKEKTFSVFSGAIDIDAKDKIISELSEKVRQADVENGSKEIGKDRSMFIDIYVNWALEHMQKYGTTQEQLAAVSSKNSLHGSLNPKSQYRDVLSVDDVLNAREVLWPLTLPMCSPIGDGAACAILMSEKKVRELGIDKAVRVEASLLFSGWDFNDGEPGVAETAAGILYEKTGADPADLDCVELHDASAVSEIMYYEYLGLCSEGEGGEFVEQGHSQLGGRVPVNTSGGLMRKGHPIGATGIAQIVELTEQLRGQARQRQVDNATLALAENGGGFIGRDAAALALTLLSR